MSLSWPSKDPGAILNYALDWSKFLGTDAIVASAWAISGADNLLVNAASSFAGGKVATIKLSGGSLNQIYTLVNTVTLASAQVAVQSVALKIASS